VLKPVSVSMNVTRVGLVGAGTGAGDGGDGVDGAAESQPASAGRSVRSSVVDLVAFHMMSCPSAYLISTSTVNA
jgi:hypothetical protein